MSIANRSLWQHAKALETKEYSSLELTLSLMEKAEKENPDLNAYVTLCRERALMEAKNSDKRRSLGNALSFIDGIPYAVKDNISVCGLPLSCGSRILEGYVSPYDASVVSAFSNAGCVLLGKTNMDEFAMGTGTESSCFGRTKNPIDARYVAGGSSGGSAAAVAADQAVFALGSDTGGSVRQPAAYCGTVGLRPTYSAISRYGLVGFAPSLDTVGIITGCVRDSAIVFGFAASYDAADATCRRHPEKDFTKELGNGVKGMRIALITQTEELFLTDDVRKALSASEKVLADCGVKIVRLSLPEISNAYAVYYTLSSAEASSNLSRFDGVRYGRRATGSDIDEILLKARSEGFGEEVKRRILFGALALSKEHRGTLYESALRARAKLSLALDGVLEEADAILLPTSSSCAYLAGERKHALFDAYTMDDLLCAPASLAGLPAISLPYVSGNSMPVGIQLMGRRFSESALFSLAEKLEKAFQEEARV